MQEPDLAAGAATMPLMQDYDRLTTLVDDALPITPKPLISLLNLPAELRNQIYDIAIADVCEGRTHVPLPDWVQQQPGLAGVNKQLRSEILPMYCATCKPIVPVTRKGVAQSQALIETSSAEHISLKYTTEVGFAAACYAKLHASNHAHRLLFMIPIGKEARQHERRISLLHGEIYHYRHYSIACGCLPNNAHEFISKRRSYLAGQGGCQFYKHCNALLQPSKMTAVPHFEVWKNFSRMSTCEHPTEMVIFVARLESIVSEEWWEGDKEDLLLLCQCMNIHAAAHEHLERAISPKNALRARAAAYALTQPVGLADLDFKLLGRIFGFVLVEDSATRDQDQRNLHSTCERLHWQLNA